MARPQPGDFAAFYQDYINKTEGCNTISQLINQYSSTLNGFMNQLPESKADYSYADGKWTVKDLLQHLIDTERIMTYRALTIARKDSIVLPGFEENAYAANANAKNRSLQSLKEEFVAIRQSTDLFLLSLTVDQLLQKGTANKNAITVNALAFIIFGHILHHKQILEERYL